MRIYKYPLVIKCSQEIALPEGAKILTFQMQDRSPFIWALVDPDASLESRTFRVVGTGHELWPDEGSYDHVGTVQQGPFVWHLFEMTAAPVL